MAFVDADIGQKDVGPSASVTLAYPQPGQALADATLAALHFVGAVNPMGHFLSLVTATRDLADRAEADVVVVDTTGLVQGPGRALKDQLIHAVRPDLLIALQREDELEPLLQGNRHLPVLRLAVSPKARSRSDRARRWAREERFRAYFRGAKSITLDLERTVLREMPLFAGRQEWFPGAVWAERTAEGLVVVAPPGVVLPRKSRRLNPGFEVERLCGLGDQRDDTLGLGIVDAIDFARRSVRVRTPVSAADICTLRFGELLVHRDARHQRVPL
ncbi:polynucleotide 5'-hydroxyl-kinase GRC3/NOL9 [Thiohalomonas denitrificans]|uniref:Polynucleotide 5'-hydroxyl-kinase GRC3/NOL9 n=1 Tax=Thiohalomonas denitrificans TaxID=415747 RepID=A0A1G5QRR0_9GAMM|nr:polynucleotide 5'-hydroxyl-kinase GRC3/NOL9 [Thiohalomonas denitrificans]